MSDAGSDRRRHERVRLDGRAVGRATVLAEVRVVVLSESGAELETSVPLALGSACDLSLELAHGPVDVRARVVNVGEPEPGGGRWRVAVDFTELEALDRALLQAFLERERRRPQ
ncbi:MAG TPA: PilZ domain-containing protein [Vicinamibacteria bacterium]|jgi:hypothetical protein